MYAEYPYQHDQNRHHDVPRLAAQLSAQHHFHKRGKQISQQNRVAHQRQVGHANHLEGMARTAHHDRYASHPSNENVRPRFKFEFEKGKKGGI